MKHSCRPDASTLRAYYSSQAGGRLPVFSGVRSQKGHGLGNIIGSLFRAAMPLAKSVGRTLGKHALSAGVGVAKDVMAGKQLRSSVKSRALNVGRAIVPRAIAAARSNISGVRGAERKATRGGRRKATGRKRNVQSKRARRGRSIRNAKQLDIFS